MNAKKMKLRKMTLDDVPVVAEMEKTIFSDPWSEKVYGETLKIEGVEYIVAELNNTPEEIIGACGIRNIAGDGEITNVMVRPEYRGNKVATAMLTKLLEDGIEMGVCDFTLEVRKSNVSAIHLYEKLGFSVEGVRKNFYNHPREDALIMWKRKDN